jgi:hypothetical protein
MHNGDLRSDSQADDDWHQANSQLFRHRAADVTTTLFRTVGGPSATLASVTALAASTSSFPLDQFDVASAYIPTDIGSSSPISPGPHLNTKTLRRILAARETIFKYGIYLPRSDHDADSSPESARWKSGRQLEWLRLKAVGAFEYDWTISRMHQEYPDYPVADIGRVFFIYDYKFSGDTGFDLCLMARARVPIPTRTHTRRQFVRNLFEFFMCTLWKWIGISGNSTFPKPFCNRRLITHLVPTLNAQAKSSNFALLSMVPSRAQLCFTSS